MVDTDHPAKHGTSNKTRPSHYTDDLRAKVVEFCTFAAAASGGSALRILEVGCGTGVLANGLAQDLREKHVSIVAIDPFESAIEQARNQQSEAADNLSFAVSDLLSYSEHDGSFDIIVCGRSLHHVFPLNEAVEKVYALLKPGGTLIADEFARDKITEASACFLYDRLDMFTAAGLVRADGGGGGHHHHHRHQHHTHHHHGTASAKRDQKHQGEVERQSAGSSRDQTHHSCHTDDPSAHLSYVHGHGRVGETAGSDDAASGRVQLPQSALDRWTQKQMHHDPPLPTSVQLLAAVTDRFGATNVMTTSNQPFLYMMATQKLIDQTVAAAVGAVVKQQEQREIDQGRFEGLGFHIVAQKAPSAAT